MRQEEASVAANLFSMEEWPNNHLREAVIRKLGDELARNPHFVLGNSRQVEDFIFQKSKNQDDYRRRVQKFINVINGAASHQPSYQQPMGAAAAAASASGPPTTSQHTGQPLGNRSGTFGTPNYAMYDVEMVTQESHLPFNPYAVVQQQHPQHQTPAAAQAPPQHLRQQHQQPYHHQQQIPAAAQAPPHQQYHQQQPQQQQQTPTAARAPPQQLLQQFPMQYGGFRAPPQYNSFGNNSYQAPQQQAGISDMRMNPQDAAISNQCVLPAPGTTEYEMMYHNRLRGLQPFCERLRFKVHQYSIEGKADAAGKIEMMINVLEGRQVISLEKLLNMERWILSNAEFQSF